MNFVSKKRRLKTKDYAWQHSKKRKEVLTSVSEVFRKPLIKRSIALKE
jgi:hypothetical protein